MSEVNNISVELAAMLNFKTGSSMPIGSGPRAKYEDKYASFIAGAQWQKEQDTVYIEHLKNRIEALREHIRDLKSDNKF